MTTCLGNSRKLFIQFTTSAFRKLLSIYVFSCFPFGFVGRMWDLIVSVPDHCLSFYFSLFRLQKRACKIILDYNVDNIFESIQNDNL